METPLWPLAVYFLFALILVIAMVAVSHTLGSRRRESEKARVEPYESGMLPVGTARTLFSVKFYIVALLFLVFDLEAVFIFAWAISFRETGWPGYFGALVFLIILTAVLVYEWRMGALDWSSSGRKQAAALRASARQKH